MKPKDTDLANRLAYQPGEAADVLGVGYDFFRRYIDPELHWTRRGNLKLASKSELQRWLRDTAARTLGQDRE